MENLFQNEIEQEAITRICKFANIAETLGFEIALGFSGGKGGLCSTERSMISQDYARNFICDFIIGKTQVFTQTNLFD